MMVKGIMLYGYDRHEAEAIVAALGRALGAEVRPISGSGREDDRVMDILGSDAGGDYERKDPAVLMLLDFEDEEISVALKDFPKDMRRPIFCTATESNLSWKLRALIQDLLKEREYFRRKDGEGP